MQNYGGIKAPQTLQDWRHQGFYVLAGLLDDAYRLNNVAEKVLAGDATQGKQERVCAFCAFSEVTSPTGFLLKSELNQMSSTVAWIHLLPSFECSQSLHLRLGIPTIVFSWS